MPLSGKLPRAVWRGNLAGAYGFFGAFAFMLVGIWGLLIARISAYGSGRLLFARSGLRQRLLLVFAGVGVVPTVLTLLLVLAYLTFGLSGWITRSLDQVLDSQQDLTLSYEADLRSRMRQDVALITQSASGLLQANGSGARLQTYLDQAAVNGDFWHLYLYDSSGRAIISAGPGQSFDPILSFDSFRQAAEHLDQQLDLSDTADLRRLRVFGRGARDIAARLYLRRACD